MPEVQTVNVHKRRKFMLRDLLKEKGISVYKASKDMGIAYSTLNDLVIEKTNISNTSVDILYRLACYLDYSMEYIYKDSLGGCDNIEEKVSPNVGIWWWTGEKIIGVKVEKEHGKSIDGLIHYSDVENHVTLWKRIVKDNFQENEFKSVYGKGFKSIYRGRVYYDPRIGCYEITCSKHIIDDAAFKTSVVDFYNLSSVRKEFVPLHHYENTRELTGNQAVDEDYFESSF